MTHNIPEENVIAPDQERKGVAEIVADYLKEIGFQFYALAGESEVYALPISETVQNYLWLFMNGSRITIYQGIRHGLRITAKRLYNCTLHTLEDTFGLLSEQNYL